MSLNKAERSQRIDQVLANLAALRGVTTAAIADGDGFITHIRRDFEIDTDALGAATQIVFAAASQAAMQTSQTSTRLVLCENKEGLVLLAPLARGFVLVLVTDHGAMLGAVRFEMKESLPELEQLFGA